MQREEIKILFDQQAAGYDERWAKTTAIRDSLLLLVEAALADLPDNARILCVGAGTGEEVAHLAQRFPGWSFTAVDPSGAMLEVLRDKADKGGFAARCALHEGYLESLPVQSPFDASTCFLVSQFILDETARIGFFRSIAERLVPGALLASSDLASDTESEDYTALLHLWMNMLRNAGIPAAGLEQMRAGYARDVAVLPPARITSIIAAGGFERPVVFHQAGLIHAWLSIRTRNDHRVAHEGESAPQGRR